MLLKPGFGSGGILSQCNATTLSKDLLSLSSLEGSDEKLIAEALNVSLGAIGSTSPNPAVGCVITRGDAVIARGHTQPYGGPHAERMACHELLTKGVSLEGATAYVTLEPCCHVGKQPPCVDLFRGSRLARLVVATGDPNPLVAGGGIAALRQEGIQVDVGVLKKEVRAWLLPFFVNKKFRRPFVALKWAQSLDAQLADNEGRFRWITGAPSRAYTHWLRQKYDAIVVGARTVLNDLPKLDVRDCAGPIVSQPIKVVVDRSASLLRLTNKELQQKLLNATFKEGSKCVVYFDENSSNDHNTAWRDTLTQRALLVPIREPHSFLSAVLAHMQSDGFAQLRNTRPLESLFVEGGPTLLSAFLEEGFGDVWHSFVAPFVLGAGAVHLGTVLASSSPQAKFRFPTALHAAKRHRLLATAPLGDDVLIETVSEDVANIIEE